MNKDDAARMDAAALSQPQSDAGHPTAVLETPLSTLQAQLEKLDVLGASYEGRDDTDRPSAAAAAAARGNRNAEDTKQEEVQVNALVDGSLAAHDSTREAAPGADSPPARPQDITYRTYADEDDIPVIMALIAPHLSEPYSVYCYRYFLHGWPHLCLLAHHATLPIGVIVCKQDVHRGKLNRGYIAMLATRPDYRKLGIASTLVQKAIDAMKADGAQEIILETEVSNTGALRLYQRLGFIREKRLYRFYLNASDAFRLALPIPEEEWKPSHHKVPPDIGGPDDWRRLQDEGEAEHERGGIW